MMTNSNSTEYINQIATSNANNSKDKDLASDVKKLTEAVAMLTKLVTDKENTPPGNTNNTANSGTRKQFTGVRNMGAYCYTHGYHPAGT